VDLAALQRPGRGWVPVAAMAILGRSDLDGSETHRGFGVSASDELHAGPLGFVNCVDSSAVLRGMMEP